MNKPDEKDPNVSGDPKQTKDTHSGRGKKPHHRGGHGRKPQSSRVAVNSPEFWNRVPGLLSAAGRIPSTNPMGINYSGYGPKLSSSQGANQLLAINWIPSLGPASGLVSDPINTSSQQLYTFIRQSISGSRSYDAADLTEYVFAIYNLHAFFHFCKLIYGSTQIVSPINRDIARVIIESCGLSYTDIVNHKADLLFYINNFAYKLTQFAIPGGMSMLEHWKLLLSGIFSDRYVNTLKNQFYLFVPRYFYKYAWETARLTLQITESFEPGKGITFTKLAQYGNDLMNALVGNQDVGTMSGDILRAFEGHLEPVAPISADYTITINLTSNEMLNQIRNMTFFEMDDSGEFDIEQAGAFTLYYSNANNSKPRVKLGSGDYKFAGADEDDIIEYTSNYSKGFTLIGFEDHMSEDAIMVATRMMATYDVELVTADDENIWVDLTSWGVEIFFTPTFVNIKDGVLTFTVWETQYTWDQVLMPVLESARSEFEGAPRLVTFQYLKDENDYIKLSNGVEYYALDNYLLLSFDLLKDLNYTAAQSAFYVPLAASAVSK